MKMSTIRNITIITILFLVFGGVFCFVSTSEAAIDKKEVVFATSTTGGTWYTLGLGLATLWNEILEKEGIHVFAQSSGGSTENAQMLKNKEVDICFLGGVARYYYFNGVEGYPANPDMRGMTTLQVGSLQWVMTEDNVKTGGIRDVQGMRFGILPGGSGELHFNIVDKAVGGLNVTKVPLSQSVISDAIKNGILSAGAFDGGAPTSGLMDLKSTPNIKVRILNFTQDDVDAMNKVVPGLFALGTINKNTYPNMFDEVKTAQTKDAIVCDVNVPDDVVYKILEATYNNLDRVLQIHSGNKVISLESAVPGIAIPLHKGAVKFYRDKGVVVPDVLIPPEMK